MHHTHVLYWLPGSAGHVNETINNQFHGFVSKENIEQTTRKNGLTLPYFYYNLPILYRNRYVPISFQKN